MSTMKTNFGEINIINVLYILILNKSLLLVGDMPNTGYTIIFSTFIFGCRHEVNNIEQHKNNEL